MSYENDARVHMRKEDFDEIFTASSSKMTSQEDYNRPYNRSHHFRREIIDYYSYYPQCLRKYLPKNRVGNIMILYESRGCLINIGPHWPGVIVVIFMIFGGASVNYSHAKNSIILKGFIILFSIFSFVFLMMTALSDPGIKRESNIAQDEEMANSLYYCDICCINRHVSTVHCIDCNCCIEGMDHHCPWMGKCIGRKK